MVLTTTRSWILARYPDGVPTYSGPSPTFKLVERELPPLKEDQVLVKTLYLSNDPAQRTWINNALSTERNYAKPVEINTPMHARGLAEVIESRSAALPKGTIVLAGVNWNEYAVVDAKDVTPREPLPNGLSISHYLGALGPTGLTAYYGLVVIGEAKAGQRVVVSGAAGATGSMVVQIAKKVGLVHKRNPPVHF